MTTNPASKFNARAGIRYFIRRHGVYKAVIVGTLLLIAFVAVGTAAVSWLLHRNVELNPIYFSILITLLIGPMVLHILVSLILHIDRSEEKLRALSIMDDLTDVYNRRFFLEQMEKELSKAQRYGTVFSVLAVDVDHFKQINDTYGHLAGDAVLQSMANTCMNNLRAMDFFARFGGEEFMFLLPESDKINVEAFAYKVLTALENSTVVYEGQEIRFTVSIGVKTFDTATHSIDGMLKEVDRALYQAKRNGRNCIVVSEMESKGLEAVV